MTKSIEQIRDEAADKAIGDGGLFFQMSDDGVEINMSEVFNRGFDAGARAGYLKAIEALRTEAKFNTLVTADWLEARIDEVLGK